MAYGLVEEGVLVQKQTDFAEGFIDVPDDAVCGQVLQEDGTFINPVSPLSDINYCQSIIGSMYDSAMRVLQNGYSDEEVKTFTPKQDAIREYAESGVTALSAENRAMMEGLTGSTDNAVISAKLQNMANASETFKIYLGIIERLRDSHLDILVDGQDNSSVIASLEQSYSAIGG